MRSERAMAEILTHSHSPSRPKKHGLAGALVLLLAFLFVMLGAGLSRRPADHAIVLVTSEDCLRVFDDWGCRAIVARAQAIHAETAPRFVTRETCEFVYGAGHCAALKSDIITLPLFAPAIVAIVTTPDRRGVLPLYAGPQAKGQKAGAVEAEDGAAVYYHGRPIGRLSLQKFGGADAATITDAAGQSLDADALRTLGGH